MNRHAALTSLATFSAAALAPRRPARAQTLIPVRVALNFSTYNNLPIFLAADKGYYREAGLDVALHGFSSSSTAQLPMLARGDTDVMPLAIGPPFFNQFSEGFNVKLIASTSTHQRGWNETTWLVVRQDLWDAKQIRTTADLRGKTIDGVAPGSPLDFLALTAIADGGLKLDDVHFSEKFRDSATWLTALRNKAVDVQGVPEPFATDAQVQGLAHKWLSIASLAPWFNEGYLAASAAFARDHHDALVRFIAANVRASRDVLAAKGAWTPELVASVAKWSGLTENVIREIPGPAFPGDGRIALDSIARQQTFWQKRGLVTTPVAPASIVDESILREAQAMLAHGGR